MTYALVAIVKDEAAVIERCLASVRPLISHWTIVDTGSTDDTPALVEKAFDGIPGRLLHLPFRGFGHSRTEAFVAAQGTADWLIATDADMTWEFDEGFEPDPAVDAYMLAMGTPDFSYRLPLLLNGRRLWKSTGAVHEYTTLADGGLGRREPTDKVRVTYTDRSSPEKTAWQASLLEADLETDPDNARTIFYLAQTYRELGDERARGLYLRRAGMGGFEEEAWYAQYRAALLAPWPEQATELIAAWERRPSRLEPLHALVQGLNQRGQHRSAYQLASIPVIPTTDVLFVHRSVWDWGLMFERSIAAWWAGHEDEARRIGEALLQQKLPDYIRGALLRNMAFVKAA